MAAARPGPEEQDYNSQRAPRRRGARVERSGAGSWFPRSPGPSPPPGRGWNRQPGTGRRRYRCARGGFLAPSLGQRGRIWSGICGWSLLRAAK